MGNRSLFIPMHIDLRGHPKLKVFHRALKIEKPHAIGHLAMLWMWAIEYFSDGFIPLTPEDIAEESLWSGDANEFVDALIQSGFLEKVDNGYLVTDWEDYGGRIIEKKEIDKIRSRKHYKEKIHTLNNSKKENENNAQIIREENADNTQTESELSRSHNITSHNITSHQITSQNTTPEKPILIFEGNPNRLNGSSDPATERVREKLKQAEKIYDAYPKKIKRSKAIEEIKKALDREKFDFLYQAVEEFSKSELVKNTEIGFIPSPDVWFRDERYKDDRTVWHPPPGRDGQWRYKGTEQAINSPEHKQWLIDHKVLG